MHSESEIGIERLIGKETKKTNLRRAQIDNFEMSFRMM